MKRCHDGSTRVEATRQGFAVRCRMCGTVLGLSEGPRDEVYADL